MENRNILISGASVAGPALALWLSRYGFQPTVIERAPATQSCCGPKNKSKQGNALRPEHR